MMKKGKEKKQKNKKKHERKEKNIQDEMIINVM